MKINKTLCSAIAASAIVAGCASQAVVEGNTIGKKENKLMVANTNKFGIESFEDITTNDYRQAFINGVAGEKAFDEKGNGFSATDLVSYIGSVIKDGLC